MYLILESPYVLCIIPAFCLSSSSPVPRQPLTSFPLLQFQLAFYGILCTCHHTACTFALGGRLVAVTQCTSFQIHLCCCRYQNYSSYCDIFHCKNMPQFTRLTAEMFSCFLFLSTISKVPKNIPACFITDISSLLGKYFGTEWAILDVCLTLEKP